MQENLAISEQRSGGAQPNTSSRGPPPPPPPSNRRPAPSGHHKSRSGFDDGPLISVTSFDSRPPPSGSRRGPPPPGSRGPPSNDDRSRNQGRSRPRRNSESSVIDAHEIEARDRKRSDRDTRPRDGKLRADSAARSRRDTSSDRRKKPAGLDVIDKLDATGIYGSGCKYPQQQA
jgi:hypothetical protein